MKLLRLRKSNEGNTMNHYLEVCRCIEPKGPRGGVCGNCGNAIPTPKELKDNLLK